MKNLENLTKEELIQTVKNLSETNDKLMQLCEYHEYTITDLKETAKKIDKNLVFQIMIAAPIMTFFLLAALKISNPTQHAAPDGILQTIGRAAVTIPLILYACLALFISFGITEIFKEYTMEKSLRWKIIVFILFVIWVSFGIAGI